MKTAALLPEPRRAHVWLAVLPSRRDPKIPASGPSSTGYPILARLRWA